MLTLLDKDGSYELPTGWHEVSTRQYCELDKLQLKTVEARASYFAGRPIQVNGYVADVLAFMLHDLSTEGGLSYPQDLGQETFLQVETIRGLLLAQPLHHNFGAVYGIMQGRAVFLGDSIFRQVRAEKQADYCMSLPITHTYPAVAHCLAELARLNEAFAALAEPDETESGRRARVAGSDRLAVFSHLNVARHYAERFGTTIETVYNWPWQQVALFLLQDKITAEVQDKLAQQKD